MNGQGGGPGEKTGKYGRAGGLLLEDGFSRNGHEMNCGKRVIILARTRENVTAPKCRGDGIFGFGVTAVVVALSESSA